MPSSGPADANYPKLQVSVPFTAGGKGRGCWWPPMPPIPMRFAARWRKVCARSVTGSARPRCMSPSPRRPTSPPSPIRGYLHRTDQQFHFHNEGYGSYEDFLGTLASRKRKALKRERREALENGISVGMADGQRPD